MNITKRKIKNRMSKSEISEYSIPTTHPRYLSLMLREKISEGVKIGLTVFEGLIAHGRGEAFDYLLGEQTIRTAEIAIRTAAAQLILAKNPVISVNGNVVALAAEDIKELNEILHSKIEVNIFHFSNKRFNAILTRFKELGVPGVLGECRDKKIPGLAHARARCTNEGIFTSDVVLVPLEDGDRAQALRNMGKVVITIDLNPLSRTARACNITIVDNLIRALPLLVKNVNELKDKKESELLTFVRSFDNDKNLKETLDIINKRLSDLKIQSGI